MLGLMKDLAGLLNQLSHNTLIFRLIDIIRKFLYELVFRIKKYSIKSKDQKYFLWCHLRHITPLKENAEKTKKIDKKLVSNPNYDRIEFPVQEKDFDKIEVRNNTCIHMFGYENKFVFPIYVSNQKLE